MPATATVPPSAAPGRRLRRRSVILALAAAGLALAACSGNGGTPDAQPVGSAPLAPHPSTGSVVPVPGTDHAPPGRGGPASTRPATATTVGGPPAGTVDWRNRTYEPDACGPNDSTVPEPTGGYVVRDGRTAPRSPGPDEPFAVIEVDAGIRGDLTGDGHEDVVVRIRCSGGTSPVWYPALYTVEGGVARRLGPVTLDDPTRRQLDAYRGELRGGSVDGGRLRGGWYLWHDDDPNCCPSRQAELVLAWTGSGWRLDGQPVITGAPQ
jgi:hypothetical protein